MIPVHSLWAFALASAALIAVPGPATLLVAAAAASGWRCSAATVAGIVAGDVVLITLSAVGVAGLLTRWPAIGTAVTLVGACYMGRLAWALLRSPARRPAFAPTPTPEPRLQAGLSQGFLLTVTNPKPILFFATFFPLFVHAETGQWLGGFAVLGLVFELINIVYFGGLVGLVRTLQSQLQRTAAVDAVLHRLGGLALLACAGAMVAKLGQDSAVARLFGAA